VYQARYECIVRGVNHAFDEIRSDDSADDVLQYTATTARAYNIDVNGRRITE
jgi:hypothetical protein